MPVVQTFWNGFIFTVTPGLLNFFNAHRIRTTYSPDFHRWQAGHHVFAGYEVCFHSHTMLLQGDHVTALEAFSYALSPMTAFDRIGRYCSISWNVRIMGPQHNMSYTTSSEILYRQDGLFADTFGPEWTFLPNEQRLGVSIGHDVWIGQDVLLRPGITIGTGAVIGAGAVVVKDVAPYEVVGGVPARRLKMRFPEHIVAALLDLEWWRFAIPQLPHLPWDRPEALIAALRAMILEGTAQPFESNLGRVFDMVVATD